mgnify:FL=1|jgi:hypothetical protein
MSHLYVKSNIESIRSYKMKMRHLRPVPLVSSQKGRKNERRICITRM